MKYSYYDLGEQPAGATVVVRLRGTAPNVILLDADNFVRYRTGASFRYSGGHSNRSPVGLQVPYDGHWYVVVDLGGYKGRVRGTVSVVAPEEDASEAALDRVKLTS